MSDEKDNRIAELEAVIAEAKEWAQGFNDPEAEPYSFADEMLTAASALWQILSGAPSDALERAKAAAWDEGHEVGWDGHGGSRNPYRAAIRAEGEEK